ncbi:hypothetical protein ES702_07451 [subsurface metagenome]
MLSQNKKTLYDEFLRGMHKIGGITWAFFIAGLIILGIGIILALTKSDLPAGEVYIYAVVSCVLFLLGGIAWVIRFYLTQRMVTKIITMAIQEAARKSEKATELQSFLEKASEALVKILFKEVK